MPNPRYSIQFVKRISTVVESSSFNCCQPVGILQLFLYSLIESATRVKLDPFAYLRDFIERLPSHSADRMAELTPSAWKRSQQR
jgi:transposase IS66-like protein